MKIIALLAATLAFAACGSSGTDTSDGGTTFTITSGNYTPSSPAATPTYLADNCRIVSLFSSGVFPVTVATGGASATTNFSSGTASNYLETMTISGNQLTGSVAANYQTVVGSTCTFLTRVQIISGEITANDQMHLVVQYDISNAVGSTCTTTDVDTNVLPCTSQVDFLARK
jgi:hypothetical protein